MSALRFLQVRFRAAPPLIRGALWMLGSCLVFSIAAALVRKMSAEFHPFQLVFIRNGVALLMMLPWLWNVGLGALRTANPKVHGARAVFSLASTLAWFYALATVPLAEAVALGFSAPLFATLGAVLILSERMRVRRWTALAVGFAGAALILRPGFDTVDLGQAMALLSSVLSAGSILAIKWLTRGENPTAIVTLQLLLITPFALLIALFYWRTPDAGQLVWLVAIGICAGFGQLMVVRALKLADTGAVMPLEFSRLIFAAVFGFTLFGETPDLWTWIGGLIIFASGFYIARREAKRGGSAPAGGSVAEPKS
ncbi:MAG: DMT family transporter [Alphaproteobacteria bacterium]|nr:DMT family transporter [Alphaproteobacteria bacterium]